MEENQSGTVTDGNFMENMIQNQSLAQVAENKFDEQEAAKNDDDATEDDQDDKQEVQDETQEQVNNDQESSDEENETSDEDQEDDDDGYYADDGIDESEAEQVQTNTGEATSMGQWILDQLPKINVQGLRGDKQVNLEVKRAEDLPRDFSFASEYDRQLFQQNIADQTNRAYRLAEQYNTEQAQKNVSNFNAQENREIQMDIADLQREGELKRFKYSATSKQFDNDPAVKEMQNVLDFYNEENARRAREADRSGRLYSRLSYKDAFYLYRRQNPDITPQQKQSDQERKQTTRTIARAGRGTQEAQSRPNLSRNASIDQIIAAYGLE